MAVKLICDQCGRDAEALAVDRRHRWMVEVRGITETNVGEVHRADYPSAQVHWGCLVAWVERTNAKDMEAPF